MDDRSRRVERFFEIPLLVAALLVIPSLVISTSEHSTGLRDVGRILDWAIWGAFAAEVVVMLAIVPDRKGWLRRHPLEMVIVLLTPPVLPPALAGARVLRLLRILQLFPLARYSRRVFSLEGIRYAAVLAFVAAVGGGALFAAEQHGVDAWLGIYWAVTTMTSVGYGDVLPTTTLTHILAVLLSILGVGFTTLLTGAIAQRFLTPQIEELEEDEAADIRADQLVLAELQEISHRLAAMEARIEGGG